VRHWAFGAVQLELQVVGLPEHTIDLIAAKLGQVPSILNAYWHGSPAARRSQRRPRWSQSRGPRRPGQAPRAVAGSQSKSLVADPARTRRRDGNGLVKRRQANTAGCCPHLDEGGSSLAATRRRLCAPSGAVDDIDLQLLEFGDALVDALVPYPGHRRPVFLRQWESVWQGGQLRRDFLEAEAGALPDRDVAVL